MLGEPVDIPDFTACVDRGSIHVTAPTPTIFLCGGDVPVNLPSRIKSFRDAFQRACLTSDLRRYKVRLAEEVVPFYPKGRYEDILSFESDIAQVSELVIVYPESPGSFAELGAFAVEGEISQRLLVVVTSWYYRQDSFIKLGPVRLLENRHGRPSVCVLDDDLLEIPRSGSAEGINLREFTETMRVAVDQRLAVHRQPTTYNHQWHGHTIKLIVGLVQHYGALTPDELEVSLACLGYPVGPDHLTNFVLCAKFMEWVEEVDRGLRTYYVARNVLPAISYRLRRDVPRIDRARWVADIRTYWKNRDPDRARAISKVMAL